MTSPEIRFGRLPAEACTEDFVGMLEEHGGIGYWRVDLSTESVFWSTRVCEIHGVESDYTPGSIEHAISWYHPEDRDVVRKVVGDACAAGESFEFTCRIVRRCGAERWVDARGNARQDESGRPVAIFGVFRDVTEQRETELKLREAAEFSTRVRLAIDEMDGAFVIFDKDDRLFMFNQQYLELYPQSAPIMKVGVKFEEMIRYGIQNGQYLDAIGREDEFLAERMRLHLDPPGPIEQRLPNDRWIRVSEAATADGSRVGFRIDVTAMKNLERRLFEKASEAQAASKLKDRFLANISHELRTPLNAVIGFAQLIQMMSAQEKLSDAIVGYASDIENSGSHLLTIIEDLIGLSQVQSEAEQLKLEPVSIIDLFDDARSLTSLLADQYQQQLTFTLPADQNWQILVDKPKMTHVLVNLISNGIKFSPPYSQVVISAEIGRDGNLLIKVIDQGSGIADEEQEKIFEPFERLEACDDAIAGIGVGLAFAREVVDMMDGRLGVVSREDHGSTFWLSFSLVPDAPLSLAS